MIASAIFTITSCTPSSYSIQEDLTPLPTTGVGNLIPDTIPYITQDEINQILQDLDDKDYINDVENFYGTDLISISSQTLIDLGHFWCQVIRDGMLAIDVEHTIKKDYTNKSDAALQLAIVRSALFNYCPDQQYKWEL